MSDNSSWWLLLPCGIVTLSLTIVITTLVVVFRKMRRQVTGSLRGTGQSGINPSYGGPLDSTWTPDQSPSAPAESHHHQHWQSHGHTIHHHDSGSSSSWSDSGSSSSGGDSGSSHHHHSG